MLLISLVIFSCDKENDNQMIVTTDTITEETKILTNELKGNYVGYSLSAHSPFEFVPKLFEDSTYMIQNGTKWNWEINEISLDSIDLDNFENYKSLWYNNSVSNDTLRYIRIISTGEKEYLTLLRKEKTIWSKLIIGHNIPQGSIHYLKYFKKMD